MGGLRCGYSAAQYVGASDKAQGGIAPNGAMCIPGSLPQPGVNGEILQLVRYDSGNGSYPNTLFLVVRGDFTSETLPFTSVAVGTLSYLKSSATVQTSAGNTWVQWSATVNPLPVGRVKIRFS